MLLLLTLASAALEPQWFISIVDFVLVSEA